MSLYIHLEYSAFNSYGLIFHVFSGNRWQRKDTEKRPVIYYFIGHNEQKRHIWFQILYDCFSNLTLAYGALLKLIDLYQLLYFSFAVIIDLVQFFIVIDALSQWLDNQRYENAKVNVTSFIPELFILSVYQVRKLNLTPVRNKDIKL